MNESVIDPFHKCCTNKYFNQHQPNGIAAPTQKKFRSLLNRQRYAYYHFVLAQHKHTNNMQKKQYHFNCIDAFIKMIIYKVPSARINQLKKKLCPILLLFCICNCTLLKRKPIKINLPGWCIQTLTFSHFTETHYLYRI